MDRSDASRISQRLSGQMIDKIKSVEAIYLSLHTLLLSFSNIWTAGCWVVWCDVSCCVSFLAFPRLVCHKVMMHPSRDGQLLAHNNNKNKNEIKANKNNLTRCRQPSSVLFGIPGPTYLFAQNFLKFLILFYLVVLTLKARQRDTTYVYGRDC